MQVQVIIILDLLRDLLAEARKGTVGDLFQDVLPVWRRDCKGHGQGCQGEQNAGQVCEAKVDGRVEQFLVVYQVVL